MKCEGAMDIDVIILAGGNAGGLDHSVACKGLVPICAKPMVQYVVEALRSCPPIRRIIAVMPEPGLGDWREKVDQIVVNDGNIVDNFIAAVQTVPDDRRVLVLSADIPLITPESLVDYLAKCQPFDADLYYPIASRASVEAKFPGVQRTYMRIREGTFTGGNVMLLNPETILRNRRLMESVFDARKSPLRLVRILGFGFVLKFFLRLLTIEGLERKVSQLVGGIGRAVIVEHAEIGFDVDKPADLAIATRILGEGAC